MRRVLMPGIAVALLAFPAAKADDKADPHAIPADAKAILDKAAAVELLSLNPRAMRGDPGETFQGWKVLGKTTIEKEDLRKQLVEAFEKGVAENEGSGAKCFVPRHGVRVKHDGKTADFVICFQCGRVRVYATGAAERQFLVSDAPAAAFNKALKDAGVALPEQAK